MQFVIILAVLLAVLLLVTWPFRRASDAPAGERAGGELANLEAARDAKYREIRDAELDHRTGKLSDGDYAALDNALRGEAVEILHALDRATPGENRSHEVH